MKKNKSFLMKNFINILSVFGLFITVFFLFWAYREGILTDSYKLETFLKGAGLLAPIVFFLIQIVQTVVPIIPGALTIPVGHLIFGPIGGFIINYLSIVTGSVIAFNLCRTYGRRLLWILIGTRAYKKYMKLLKKDYFNKIFVAFMILPYMPADIFCMVAGVSNMKESDFIKILILCKPISLFIYTITTVYLAKVLINLM